MNGVKSTIKYGKKAISTILAANVIYFGGLIGTGLVANIVSPKITTQGKLEQLVKEERRKIDPLNNDNISANIFLEKAASSRKLGDRSYQIEMGGFFATETTLRHELYHILDGHCDDNFELNPSLKNKLRYIYWHEPQARIYQITGLKP